MPALANAMVPSASRTCTDHRVLKFVNFLVCVGSNEFCDSISGIRQEVPRPNCQTAKSDRIRIHTHWHNASSRTVQTSLVIAVRARIGKLPMHSMASLCNRTVGSGQQIDSNQARFSLISKDAVFSLDRIPHQKHL